MVSCFEFDGFNDLIKKNFDNEWQVQPRAIYIEGAQNISVSDLWLFIDPKSILELIRVMPRTNSKKEARNWWDIFPQF